MRTKAENNNDSCVHKTVSEDAKKAFEGNKRLRSIEAGKMVIEKQEEAINPVKLKHSYFYNKDICYWSTQRKFQLLSKRKNSAIYYQINLPKNC